MTPEYLVIHTAAFKGKNCDADKIDQWHKGRGWSGIGYHYVILNNKHDTKPDGKVEKGRSEHLSGAHALGINSKSLGICCTGHGDYDDFTEAQYQSLTKLIKKLMQQYSIPLHKVIGHREINDLIQQGLVSENYRTSKSCPGSKVDMNRLRDRVSTADANSDLINEEALVDSIALLKTSRTHFHNARDELDHFLNHPEVIELMQSNS